MPPRNTAQWWYVSTEAQLRDLASFTAHQMSSLEKWSDYFERTLFLNLSRSEGLKIRMRVLPENVSLHSFDGTSPLVGSPGRNKPHVTLCQYVIFTQIPVHLSPARCWLGRKSVVICNPMGDNTPSYIKKPNASLYLQCQLFCCCWSAAVFHVRVYQRLDLN